MKRIPKLAFFFCNSFILLLLFSAGFYFLDLWVQSVKSLSSETDLSGKLFSSLSWAVPVSLYISVLLSHTYAARNKVPSSASVIAIIILSGVLMFGSSIAIEQFKKINFQMGPEAALIKQPGLILTRGDVSIITLREDGIRGPRVVSFPDQELLYQGEDWGPVNNILVPVLPFGGETAWPLRSLFLDFGLSARQLNIYYHKGFYPFFFYGGSLILLLGSLRILLGISSWPLANLFIGILIFRGILAFETFLNTAQTQQIIFTFLGENISPDLITPLVFSCLGALIILYTFLSSFAWGRNKS